MAKIKISQLTAKTTNLLATDLLEVSEVSGLTYVSKKITGQQIIDGLAPTFVPYTGASANVNLGEYEIKVGQLTLDTSPTGTAAVGTTRWNDSIGSTETTLKGGSVILKNGVDLVARVVNKVTPNTTLTKAAYQVVKISGAQGQRLAVDLAQANNDNNSADTLGIVTETIATNQEGFIMTVGQLEGVNTTGSLQGETWADGNVLYLSPTTPGAITNVKPTGATGHIVVIGYVEYSHAINGKIYVKIMNGWELDELHNVYINTGTLANNDALIYESSTQLWKNKTIATALGYTPVTNARTITINGTTQDLSADRTFTISTGITVGTTAVTSGTDGRVFFQAGGVIQQDANFTYDNTLKRLGLKAVGTGASDIPFAIQNSAGTANLMQVAGDNTMTFLSSAGKAIFSSSGSGANLSMRRDFSNEEMIKINASDYPFIEVKPINTTSHIAVGTLANGASTWWDGVNYNFQIKNSFHNLFHVVGNPNSATATFRLGTIASNTNFFNIHGRNSGGTGLTTNPIFTINSSGTVGIGTEASTPSARLDVRAQGALSTDIAFRVRNSADNADIFKILGNTNVIFGGTGADYLNIIGGSSWGTDCYFNFSSGNYIRYLGQNGDISIFTNSSLRSRGTYIGGATQLVYFDNGGNIRIGQGFSGSNQPDVNATRTIQQMTGVAPTTSVADGFQQYSADITAGNASPHFRTENGSIIKLYQNTAVTTPQGIADALTNLGVLATSTIAPAVQSVASAATVTPALGNDLVIITAQAVGLTLANPTGTWSQGKDLMIRILDNGSAQTIAFDTKYRAIGVTLPTTTTASKTTYLGCIYNATDDKFDVIGVTTQV